MGDLNVVIAWDSNKLEIILSTERYRKLLQGLDDLRCQYTVEQVDNRYFINLKEKPCKKVCLLIVFGKGYSKNKTTNLEGYEKITATKDNIKILEQKIGDFVKKPFYNVTDWSLVDSSRKPDKKTYYSKAIIETEKRFYELFPSMLILFQGLLDHTDGKTPIAIFLGDNIYLSKKEIYIIPDNGIPKSFLDDPRKIKRCAKRDIKRYCYKHHFPFF